MTRWFLTLVGLLGLGGLVLAESPEAERAQQELQAVRLAHLSRGEPGQRAIYAALEDARAAQQQYYQREREVEEFVIVDESLVHRDRRYVAEGKPAALARKLAAEREQAAADRRLRRWGKWAKRRYPVKVRQAELWTIDAVEAELYRNERFRREVCRKALELAAQMEREAARKPSPRKLK